MKITDIQYKVVEVKRKCKFTIALATNATSNAIIVKVTTDEGIIGYGEASPFSPVTGDSNEDILQFFEHIKPRIIGENPLAIEKIHRIMNRYTVGKSAGKAGIDIALYDILGKKTGLPLYMLLGGNSNEVQSDMTVGIDTPDEMAKLAKKYVDEGFRILKIKVGINHHDDLEAVRKIRELVGPDISLRLDANQGWGKKETVEVMKQMEQYGVDEIEQPIPYWNVDDMRFIKDHISQEMMVDEAVHSPRDVMRIAKAEAADLVNIKLMKSGGLYPALQINAVSQSAGLPCMVGCMSECRIGIAAGAALVAAQGNITLADLDSYRMIEEIDGISGGFETKGDMIYLTDKPGLGVEVDF